MENMSEDTKEKLNELIIKFTYVLESIYLCDEKQKQTEKLRELETYLRLLRKNRQGQQDDNTKLIRASMSYLIDLQKKEQLSKTELLDSYDKVIVALEQLSLAEKGSEIKIRELRNWVCNRYNELRNYIYGTKEEISDSSEDSLKIKFQDKITELIQSDTFKVEDVHFPFYRILSYITEEKNTNEKIKSYIEDAFIFLLFCFFKQRLMCKGVKLEDWIDTIESNEIAELNKTTYEYREYAKLKNKGKDYNSLIKYLWQRDIQFWFKIINRAKSPIKNKKSLDISKIVPYYLTEELWQYRNMAAHSRGNTVDPLWLIRTLRALITFTKNLANIDKSWNVETSLLEKRLFFEICNENKIALGEKPLTNYGNIKYPDIANLQQTKNKIECWKNILKTKTAYDYMSPSFTVDQKPEIIARAVTQQLFEECTEENEAKKKNAINQIESYYADNSIFFPFWISDIPFRNLLEAGYPFHPMFFIFTKKLPPDEVIRIAKDCIWNALSSSEQHPLIMPYDIDINECMKDTFINYYTAGKTIRSDFTPEATTNYFEWLYDFFYKEKSEIWETAVKEGKDIDATVFSNVCKAIVMLSIDEMKKKYYDSPSRFWIRLCCCHPNESIVEVEKTLDFLDGSVSFYFSLPQNPFQLIKPLAYKELMKKMFVYVGSKTDKHTLSDTELKEHEMTISNIHFDFYRNFGYLEISLEGYNLIKDILSGENDDLKNIKDRLTSDEILFSNNFLEKYEGKIKETSPIRINDFPDDELNYFCSLYGKCEAGLLQNEMILEAQIKQYSRIAWYYCQSSGVAQNYQFR